MKLLYLGDMAGYNAKLIPALLDKGVECKLLIFQEKMIEFHKKSGNINKTQLEYAPDINITDTESLVDFIKKYQPDCVFSICTASMVRTSLLVSVPWIMQFYGSDIRWNKLSWLTRFLLKFYKLRRNRYYSVTTPDLLLIKKDAFYVDMPLDSDFWKPIEIEREKNTIFFPHRFDDSKNVSLIMDVWDEIKEKGVHLKLIDWGDRITEFKKRFGTENMTILSFMSEEKLREEINKSSVVWAQFGYPSCAYGDLYALACQRPLIGPDLSGLPVDYEAPTIQCKSKEEIVLKTLELLETPSIENFEGRKWIIKFHDNKRVAEKAIKIVEEIIRRRKKK
ncbi:MAG: glycosyltransferase [Candidatus Heimdallarchaeota archaeon]|nr:glycosyltransferase [Candidatus Heimdallarchaeota archaeon]